ncbi:hypothetical protein L9F63_024696, partial [Diploptera punctata]
MAPAASKLSSKLKSWVKIDDSFTIDGDVVLCQACNNQIGCSMISQLEQHVRSALHAKTKDYKHLKKKEQLPNVKLPPEPVLTRWGHSFPKTCGMTLKESLDIVEDVKSKLSVALSIAYLQNNVSRTYLNSSANDR